MKLQLLLVCIFVIVISTSAKEFSLEDIVLNLVNPDRYEQVTLPAADNIFRFMVFGDFGNIPTFFNIGKTGDTMNELAKQNHQEYMITVGDNFYPNGVMFTWFRLVPWLAMSQFKKSAPGYFIINLHILFKPLHQFFN